jgi:hypothetical protein
MNLSHEVDVLSQPSARQDNCLESISNLAMYQESVSIRDETNDISNLAPKLAFSYGYTGKRTNLIYRERETNGFYLSFKVVAYMYSLRRLY